MDNNYNIQNNNMGQAMYQPVPEQSMIQPMNVQKPKKKKGLIIGLTIGIVLALTTVTLLAIFVWGSEPELEGKWITENGSVVKFEKVIENDDDQDGYIYYSISVDGEKIVSSCPREDNMIEITYKSEIWSDVEQCYIYDFDTDKVKIVKLTKRTLVIEFEGEEYKLKRK